nr:hypothetical protein [Tanacetum cinerariifolium]
MQTQTSNTLHNAIMEAGSKDRPPMLAPDKEVLIFEGCPVIRTRSYMETYKTVSQDIHDQLNAEAEANSSTRSQQTATRNRGKAIVNSPQPIYDQEPSMVSEDDETSKDKDIDNSPRINRGTGYENQRIGNVAGARETVEQANWRDDIDDESDDLELEAHYMYMAKLQEVSPDADDSGPIFDAEPVQK